MSPNLEQLTEAQKEFLELCAEVAWGTVQVTVQDGQPAGAKVLERTYRFGKFRGKENSDLPRYLTKD